MANIVVTSYENELRSTLKYAITGASVKTAYNIVEASEIFNYGEFNVLILDLDSGISSVRYLKLLSDKYDLFVILTGSDTKSAFRFMDSGFGEFIVKPDNYHSKYVNEFVTSIVQRIKQIGEERASRRTARVSSSVGRFSSMGAVRNNHTTHSSNELNEKVITIASSTGGTEALVEVLSPLPQDMPPILIVQHFPPNFTKSYAQRIDKVCNLNIKVAEPFEYIERGTVYFAEAGAHMKLIKERGRLAVESRVGKRINGVMPSADVLFDSVAEVMKANAIGVILTGMGNDGAKGLLNMKYNGARTMGQNEETCVVYGMPKAANAIGAVDIQLPLSDIAKNIIRFAR
jgi:two-component system chemotaxis response regulator CheB